MTEHASIPGADAIHKCDFTTTVGGYESQLDEHRSVKLHLGCDQNGERRWALITENRGVELKLGFSDEAMNAVMGMFELLLDDEVDASAIEAGTDETHSGSAEGESAPGRPNDLTPSRDEAAGVSPSPAASPSNRSMTDAE